MEKFILSHFEHELYDEMYEAIVYFLSSPHIREGKFNGNEVLLNKLNLDTVIIYKEYELDNGQYKYTDDSQIWDISKLLNRLKKFKAQLK